MMKISVTHRIPTEQYAYLEFADDYDSIEDAFKVHRNLLCRAGTGLDQSTWKTLRRQMYETGQFDNDRYGRSLNADQYYFVNQMKLIQRELKANDPVIN